MNHKDALEQQLAGWTPRRPSERLTQRLFGMPPSDGAGDPGPVWPWLTSAGATGLVSMILLASSGLGGGVLSRDLASGSPARSLVARDSQSHANHWGGQRFEWTRPGVSPSSSGSVMVLATNRLAR